MAVAPQPSRFAALMVIAAMCGVAAPAAAQTADPSASDANRAAAQDAHRRALELFDQGQHAEALAEFKRAYALAPSFRILYNVGLSQAALGDASAAVAAFTGYLREGGERIPAPRRAQVEAEIARLSRQLATLDIQVEEPNAEVSVDSQPLERGPISRQLRLGAGRHVVAVRSADGTLKTQSVTLAAGAEQSLRFQAPSATTPQSPQTSGTAPPVEPGPGARRSFPWIAWGVTGALGATAAVTGVLALGAHADQRDAKATQGVTPETLSAAHDKVQNFALATDILLVSTALSAGVSVYLTFQPTRSVEPETSQTSLLFGPGHVSLRHTF
jgi:hypothetical protein